MNENENILQKVLKEKGYSLTKQRIIVFNYLLNLEPISLSDLTNKLKNQLDRASIYRIINLFNSLGIIYKVNLGWKYKIELSDIFQAHHHHLTCLKCNKIIPIHEDSLETLLDKIAEKNKFKILNHQIEIQGYCSDCK